MKLEDMHFNTLAIRAGQEGYDPVTGAIATPIYQTTNYAVANVDEGAEYCTNLESGYIYTRLWSPTQKVLEEKLAALEGGESAAVFASGVAAITSFFMGVLRAGDHVISDYTVYSATQYFFTELLAKFQVEVTFVDTCQIDQIEKAIRPNTKVIYFETPANPTIKIVDIQAVVQIAVKHKIMTVVDSTFASPYLQRPLQLGVDAVIQSATKYLGGHGDVQCGAIIGRRDLIMGIRQSTLKNVSLGDVDTLIQHAASMTHVLVPLEERLKAGITDGLIRLSVGIEDHRDIIADLDQAFGKVNG